MATLHRSRRLWAKAQQAMPVIMIVFMCGLAFAPFVSRITYKAFDTFWTSVVDDRYAWAAPLALAALLIDVRISSRMEAKQLPWLEKSWFASRGNTAYAPVQMKWLGIPYIVLLAYCMPLLALAEEIIFRMLASHLGIVMLLIISGPVFGVVHLLSGANTRRVICTSVLGLAMAGIYLMSGLIGVFVFHASYNLIVNGWVMYELKLKPLAVSLQKERAATLTP